MPHQFEFKDMQAHIQPLVINGLSGRMLQLPSTKNKKRELLIIYGQHTSLERMYSLAQELSRFGRFGGMDALYKIGEVPNLDEMADYLAAVVKLCYNRKRVTIIGISYGFVVVTRMLQRYPELSKKVDLLISLVGFVHYQDFKFKAKNLKLLRAATRFFSYRIPAWIARHIFLRGVFIRAAYALVANKHSKLKDANPEERRRRIRFEIMLWKCNDIRTYMHSINELLLLNLCTGQVKLPVYHISVAGDQYFDNYKVEQHMRVIFTDFKEYKTSLGTHMPTIVATSEEIAPLLPVGLRRLLSKAP